MAVKPHGLANRPGEPYPATFRIQWTGRGIEPRSPRCKRGIFPLDEPPMFCQRSVWGSNPAFRHTKAACSLSTYRPMCSLQSSDPGWNRTITFLVVTQAPLPLDHGIRLSVTEVGVEPTGTRLSTSSLCRFAYPVMSQ
jgi:hypothetical protein